MSISNNSRNLREDDVINEPDNGSTVNPVSAYQVKLINAKAVKTVSLPVTSDAFTAALAFTNAVTGLAVGDTILEIILTCKSSVTGGTMTLKHAGGAAISSVLACAVVNTVARTTLLVAPVITASGLSVLSASTADRGTLTIMYI